MNIMLLYFMMQSMPLTQDKLYTHTEIKCSVWYTIKKKWDLHLKEYGTFSLKFNKEDTRYKKKKGSNFFGTWVSKGDTIILTVSAPLPTDCGLKGAKYILSRDTLKSLMIGNICLPSVLEPVKMNNGD
ncbi:hypothetical protein HF329_05600 [Chitinophaga oryzae]|uniref:Uncharacterized protein n=1 Tax=Chitinophaga oryzae TaxID=2725414 RepID=A0AAE6ZEM1_9BACT|nr:copper resistance protein NlpE [Chitinophaga oryzae]QJB30800.1 hypothetical protein HF329_05600 [Chitinophaga oryzae]